MIEKVLAAGFWISFGVMLGRVAGFLREATLAAKFGVSTDTDIAVLALTVPDLLVNIFIMGGLTATLIPEFKRLNGFEAGHLFVQFSLVALFACSACVVILGIFSEQLVFLFAPGFSDESLRRSTEVMQNVLWVIPLTVLAGVTSAFLQSQYRFLMPSMGTLIFNASVVVGLLFFVSGVKKLDTLVVFIILGGFARWLSQLFVARNSFSLHGCFDSRLLNKNLFSRYWQAVTAIGMLSLYPVALRSASSFHGEGEMALVNFAFRLIDFPLGAVITVVAVALFPKLSSFYAKNDKKNFEKYFKSGVYISVLFASAIAGVLGGGAGVFVEIVYERGGVTAESVMRISNMVTILVFSLPFHALLIMTISGFNAKRKPRTPMMVLVSGFFIMLLLFYFGLDYSGIENLLVIYVAMIVVVGLILFYRLALTVRILDVIRFVAAMLTVSVAGYLVVIEVSEYVTSNIIILFSSVLIIVALVSLSLLTNRVARKEIFYYLGLRSG
jgi:murein biosynthesis integral membrane protein MurJ